MNINELNKKYAIQDHLVFVEGNGSLPMIRVDNGKAVALVSVYAGQVLSFTPAGESDDLLFLSKKAYYQEGKAIKGGVPVCWPWFGADPENKGRPAHGFVRNRMWEVVGTSVLDSGETEIRLGLEDTEQTRDVWPHSFSFTIIITIGFSLTIELLTRNTGNDAFTITQALHTYFKIGDIVDTNIHGLDGAEYIDKVDGGALKTQVGEVVIAQEVDRIYLDVGKELVINDTALDRKIKIQSTGNKTAVIWNPWIKICTEMADLDDEDYRGFVCVETTNAASDSVEVNPGEQASLVAKYSIEHY